MNQETPDLPGESKTLEYKEVCYPLKSSDFKSYLKTVSAYANYITGDIVFGVTNNRQVQPVENPEQFCLDLENQINDNLQPVPDFSLEIMKNQTIKLTVEKGKDTPYLYKGIAYYRRDSSSTPVGREQLRRLSLSGANIRFEDLSAPKQDLTFETFNQWCIEKIRLNAVNEEILKSFQMYSEEGGFTNAALLISDQNSFNGISVIQFGETMNEIRRSCILGHRSVLDLYSEMNNLFEQEYSLEIVKGTGRELTFQIPYEAFRETIANSLVHRDWQISADIQVSFFDDRIVIESPGGLSDGLTEEDYLNKMISMPRNMNLAIVFNRLGLIERFGTGIGRIRQAYQNSMVQPDFEITDRHIIVTLPVQKNLDALPSEANTILTLIRKGIDKRTDLITQSGQNVYQINKALKYLQKNGLIRKIGNTRAARYIPSN